MRTAQSLRPLLFCCVTGCVASWHTLVRYSTEPAPPGESLTTSIYEVVLPGIVGGDSRPVLLLSESDSTPQLAAVVEGGHPAVPGYWADTLRREVQAALSDPALMQDAAPAEVLAAATSVGVRLLADSGASGALVEQQVARLRLSRPGFNKDSTIAAVRADFYCGFLCGEGVTLLLARRPGYRWRVWQASRRWVS